MGTAYITRHCDVQSGIFPYMSCNPRFDPSLDPSLHVSPLTLSSQSLGVFLPHILFCHHLSVFVCVFVFVCVLLHRSEMQQLALEKQHLEETVRSLRARCSDMEDQCVQHGRLHKRMKDRYASTSQA